MLHEEFRLFYIVMNPAWLHTDKTLTSLRTPSSLLLNEKKEFEAYGYEAEKLYLELVREGRQNKWFYFRRFKPKLTGIQVILPACWLTFKMKVSRGWDDYKDAMTTVWIIKLPFTPPPRSSYRGTHIFAFVRPSVPPFVRLRKFCDKDGKVGLSTSVSSSFTILGKKFIVCNISLA